MRFSVRIRCGRCGTSETIVATDDSKSIHALAADAYQADQTRINPDFRFPVRIVAAAKRERNWVHIPMCKACREAWAEVEADIDKLINDFRSNKNGVSS